MQESETLLSQGAEAKIFVRDGNIVKERIQKTYRIPEIDDTLRKERTKREAKVLEKASSVINVPKVISVDKYSIVMEKIDGDVVKNVLNKENEVFLMHSIAKSLAELHNRRIIHGDLTTSNMILKGDKLYFIDFGLAFHSQKEEDRAVDIHLFKRALESKHYELTNAFDIFLKEYEKHAEKSILDRLEQVEARGRYKH